MLTEGISTQKHIVAFFSQMHLWEKLELDRHFKLFFFAILMLRFNCQVKDYIFQNLGWLKFRVLSYLMFQILKNWQMFEDW